MRNGTLHIAPTPRNTAKRMIDKKTIYTEPKALPQLHILQIFNPVYISRKFRRVLVKINRFVSALASSRIHNYNGVSLVAEKDGAKP